MSLYIFKHLLSFPEGCDIRSISKQKNAGLNAILSFSKISCLTKAKELSLSYCLPTAGSRGNGFILFSRALVQSK